MSRFLWFSVYSLQRPIT